MTTKRMLLALTLLVGSVLCYGRIPYMCGVCAGLGLGVLHGMRAVPLEWPE